jgi:hypothetical protein
VVTTHLRPWSGVAYRHIPTASRSGVLDTRFAALARDNRWNEPGDATFSAASDHGVAMAEFGRHMAEDRDAAGRLLVQERAVYRLEITLSAVLDLRQPMVRRALGLAGGPERFLDRAVARATAAFVRRTTAAEAVLVPSVAFLDDPDRWNVVLFLEKLPADLTSFITATPDGTFRVAA